MKIGDKVKVVQDTTKDGSLAPCVGKTGTILDIVAYVVVCLNDAPTHSRHDYTRMLAETSCVWWCFKAEELEVIS